MLEPAVLEHHIQASVSIDVADTQTVCEALPLAAFGDGREFPLCRRIAPVRRGVAKVALIIADDLGFAVAGKVDERRRLVVHVIEHGVTLPVLLLALRIEVKIGGRVRQAIGQHVIPSVAVEVVSEREEVVGGISVAASEGTLETGKLHLPALLVFGLRGFGRRINLMTLRKVRPLPPVGSGNGIGPAVPVEIAQRRPLAPVMLVQLLLLEAVQREIRTDGCQ